MAAPNPRDDLRRLAGLARRCTTLRHAGALVAWIEDDARPVTAGRVLRRADVPVAGAALGVSVPARVRTAADVRALHRPWCVALALGLLRIGDGIVERARVGGQGDEEVLEGWRPAFERCARPNRVRRTRTASGCWLPRCCRFSLRPTPVGRLGTGS
ncbi:MAG: hypothetical protein ACRDQ1_05455 [Sciscionella sp.]